MRIVMVVGSLSRRAGGLYWSVRRLSQSLKEAGIDVHVLGLRDPDTIQDLDSWMPIEPNVLRPLGPVQLGYSPNMKSEIARLAPDIVHLHGIWQFLSLSTSAWAGQGGALMVSPRGMLDAWAAANSKLKKQLAWYAFERTNLHRAAAIHALNNSEAASVRVLLPLAQVAVIPNGMDISNELMNFEQHKDGKPRLLFLSRIHPKKGLAEFLDQWKLAQPRLSRHWILRIAGPDEGGHLPVLRTLVSRLGLEHCVEFIGPKYGKEKEQELSRATAFVLPSKSEGLPMAVLEAWAAGLPVLMTQACNLPEGFEFGAARELVDADSIVHALEYEDLAQIGAMGQKLVSEKFTWERIALEHIVVYKQMLLDQNIGVTS